MSRSDLILNLVQAGKKKDDVLLNKTVEAIIAEERSKNHHLFANKLQGIINTSSNGFLSKNGHDKLENILYEKMPEKNFHDLIIDEYTKEICTDFIEEQFKSELLKSYNISPKNRILLYGPPGNGKTSLAEVIANSLMVPLFVVRYEGVVGSFLGETANRLKNIFDYIRTQKCVIFFDEFDTIGKERGDLHETGEIKRVVSSLLLQIDKLPSYVTIIAASNHVELLDRAVWRRFQIIIKLEKPSKAQIENYLIKATEKFAIGWKLSFKNISEKLVGLNYSDIEEFCFDVIRKKIVSLPNENLDKIINKVLKNLLKKKSLLKTHA